MLLALIRTEATGTTGRPGLAVKEDEYGEVEEPVFQATGEPARAFAIAWATSIYIDDVILPLLVSHFVGATTGRPCKTKLEQTYAQILRIPLPVTWRDVWGFCFKARRR